MSWVEMKARGLRQEAEGILAVELCMADASPLPFRWEPGAHVDVQTGSGVVRQYSLTNLADEGCVRLAIKHADDSRGGSRWLHQQLRVGDRLRVSAPRNLFPLQPGNGPVLLVAAGIGVTPLLAMYRQCRAQQRPVQLLYFSRSAAHGAFVEQLRDDPAVRLISGLCAADVGAYLDQHLPAWQPDSQLYTCGPDGFMSSVQQLAGERGWPSSALFQEHFQASIVSDSPATELVLARSGKSVTVQAGETLVAAAERAGVSIPTSCGMGMCGACMTGVVSGEVEHRDQYLSDAERASGQWIMPCVSGCAGGRLELNA
ncbi:PDR/VanB family oxidoreductase [Pseudomonas turukhanskensis]|uniref:Vanillate O-demethylase n=1 Tax=Pseudomonas turukhanskensis TaxID=1806536 RepID=A0A9W6KCA0_9PSED|nr:PDR/VanB family oxidoreductase [Pseudomonas turukhanskensis]GLK92211.1 vanillate O-demethylase [Pseudomonas turukhanskensis]